MLRSPLPVGPDGSSEGGEAGVDARLREHPAPVHGFLGVTGVVPAADAAVTALHRKPSELLGA